MNSIQFKKSVIATTIAIMLSPANTLAKPNKVKQFGKHAPFSMEQLPNGKVKSKLKALRSDKRDKAMKWLHSFAFSEHDLKHMQIDNEGGVLFGDSFDMTELTEHIDESTSLPQAISSADTFKLHSKPGASNIIYLDFNGHTISGTAWNSGSNIQARAYDTDGDVTSFGSTEHTQIAEVWHRIAEDFAPFDVDVTTEEPANFGATTGRILITHNKDVAGNDMPYSGGGGVAYVNVWGRSNYASYYSPALVYYNNLGNGFAPYVAEAASHEMGHNLGLSHDGTSAESYYRGQGSGFVSWAPIMGVGYYNNVTQWSKGEYTDASMFQDDINIISNHLTFRLDDHGNDIYNPTALLVDAQGNISSTSTEDDPHKQFIENKGIIETENDVDYFAFDAGAGGLNITITPAWDSFYRSSRRGANLDVSAKLYNWNGDLVASSDPLDETDAELITSVPAGQYLLAISGTGNNVTPYSDYGSLGQYYIAGNVQPFSPISDNTPPSPSTMTWTVAPFTQSRNSISMQATTATDDSGSVQYNFICSSNSACSDSGWQISNQYTASNLAAGSNFSFQVIARDAYLNETNPSTPASASTTVNNPPQTNSISSTTAEDNTLEIDLSAQSSDADADLLSYSILTQPLHGTIINNNGVIQYTPANNFNGVDSFNFKVSDNYGGSASGTVSITVTEVNDAPVASASAPANNSSLTVNFSSAGSFDPDASDNLTYSWSFGDGNSSSLANPEHTYSAGGNYSVSLTITDNQGLSDFVSLTTRVTDPVNLKPEAPSNLSYTLNKTVSGRGKNKVVSGSVLLSWNTANFANSYNIWRCNEITSGKGKNRTTSCDYQLIKSTNDISFSTPLSNETARYKVNASNTNGYSNFSNQVTVNP